MNKPVFGIQCRDVDDRGRSFPVGTLVFTDRNKANAVREALMQHMHTRVVIKTRFGWIEPEELPYMIDHLTALNDELAQPLAPRKAR